MSFIFDLLRLVYDALLHIDLRRLTTPPYGRLHQLADRLIIRTHKLAGLKIDQYFSTRFSYPSWMILPFASGDTNYCNKMLEEMEKIWKFTFGGSLLLISYVYIASLIYIPDRFAGSLLHSSKSTLCVPPFGVKPSPSPRSRSPWLLCCRAAFFWSIEPRYPRRV